MSYHYYVLVQELLSLAGPIKKSKHVKKESSSDSDTSDDDDDVRGCNS